MPHTHTRTFRVRYYECDGYGHVNNAVYLRYMQEAAFDASAAAGFGLERYAALGRLWFPHETEIDYLRPLTHGDEVEVTTWVLDFRRVRSRRAYEFRRAGSADVIARACTDWAFLDATTQRPAAIPPGLIAAFFPEGAPPPAPPRQPFPSAPPPPPGVFKTRRRVEWRDIDPAQHVNNANYIAYIGEAGFAVAEAHGWPAGRILAEGLAVVARRHQIEYRAQTRHGDELEIATWLSDVRRAQVTRHYTLTRVSDNALVARVRSQYAWINRHTQQPARIPAHFLADFAPNIAATKDA
jgi:acyl-CoA thioester hydrolase